MASTMSSYHRQKSCGPCALCGKVQTRYDHFSSFSKGEQQYVTKHYCQIIAACAVPIELKRSAIDQTQNMYLHGEKK